VLPIYLLCIVLSGLFGIDNLNLLSYAPLAGKLKAVLELMVFLSAF
jgi:hypothetical protein